jgi:hypothetical protein
MKTNQSIKYDLSLLRTKGSKAILKHILSPLEQAAMRHSYQPFNYNLDGTPIYISSGICKRLVNITTKKTELMSHAIRKESLAKDIPHKLREVFDDPRIILSLHPRLRNRLCSLQCYTLFAVIKKAEAILQRSRHSPEVT